MKICFLSSMHPPFDKRVFNKEAVSLAKAGFEVCHVCPGEDSDAGMRDGVKVITYARPSGLKGRLRQLGDLYHLAKKLDYDCYHCNEVDSWVIGVILKIFKRKLCVFDVHEHYPSTFSEMYFPKAVRPFVAGMLRLLFFFLSHFTDKIVLAKRTVAADYWCEESKKVLVQNFSPLSKQFEERAQQPLEERSSGLHLIHLGLISKSRGWPQMLEALAETKREDISLNIVGEFNDGSKSEFVVRVKELGLTEQICTEDWLPFEKAFERILGSDVGLVIFQPGVQNNVYALPHKLFDYMMGGLAVIAPNFAEEVSPIVAECGCGVLINTSSPRELAKAISDYADNLEKTKEMGRNGYKAVIKNYNWETEAAKLIEMYERLERTIV